jgi:hypothetical protein
MKKINTLLKNEKIMATVIIGSVFLITGIITVIALYTES